MMKFKSLQSLFELAKSYKYTQDKHSAYKIGDIAEWKDGVHQKTAHGWIKIPEEKDIKNNKINRIKSITKLTNEEFYNSDKSFLLPPIRTSAWKRKTPKNGTKKLLLKRHIIHRNTEERHPEFYGEDKKIINIALKHGNIILHNKPEAKPNYYVIAKMKNYVYLATIDIDPKKKYNEIVDWRKVNKKKFKL